MTVPLLEIQDVSAFYGNIQALKGVSLDVNRGEIVTLIGANGAGKSTLMMTVFGSPRARDGEILFEGKPITQLSTHAIARLRIAQSPEGRRIFQRMTVLENLQMGASVDGSAHFEEDLARVTQLFPRLRERLTQRGGTLSGGEQQMLAIARALMSRPKLTLGELNRQGMTIFLVEQNAFHALKLAHRAYVMVNGVITMSGSGRELLARPEIRQAYLEGGRH
ncbi:MAG: ABC transporter ATP-binding protein [Rhizobiales bacterium]|nr:ABC transporter ATP-binding protein [Hyphomicrobiales bacterium]